MNFNYNKIKKNNLPYIIAEIGVNHECSGATAKRLIWLAKKGGAHATKFQTYTAEKLAKVNSRAYWDISKEKTKSQFELFSKLDKIKPKDYRRLARFCRKNKIDFLSTPFDLDSVKMLKPLVPAFKISSSDITNYPLLEKISKTKKPSIISTGASTLDEIRNAVKILKKGSNKIVIMHCILNYPTQDKDANLSMITSLKKEFPKYIIGYSDHTLPNSEMINLTSAFILGAKVIEKHFTHNKKLKGNDHYHSMDKKDLAVFSQGIDMYVNTLGNPQKMVLEQEQLSRKNARRSLVASKDLPEGTLLELQHFEIKRPCFGLQPKDLDWLIGRRLKKEIQADDFFTIDHIL